MSSAADVHVLVRCKGVGLGAGVGGEAGAEGRSGFGIFCGTADGVPVFGVGGGLGCECLMVMKITTLNGPINAKR